MIYDIAGLRVDIRNKYDFADTFCREYLADDQSAPADIVKNSLHIRNDAKARVAERQNST